MQELINKIPKDLSDWAWVAIILGLGVITWLIAKATGNKEVYTNVQQKGKNNIQQTGKNNHVLEDKNK